MFISKRRISVHFLKMVTNYWQFGILFLFLIMVSQNISTKRKEGSVESTFWKVSQNEHSHLSASFKRIVSIGNAINETQYVDVGYPHPKTIFLKNNDAKREIKMSRSSNSEDPIRDYFDLLKVQTGSCRKLFRMGGQLTCRYKNTTIPNMDGNKLICLDPEFQIGTFASRTEDCLVLSFGIQYDVSFDLAIRDANCQVMMFDVLDYRLTLPEKETFMQFQQVGLGSENLLIKHGLNKELTIELSTFDYIVYRFGLTNRLINVLKIDIEGNEWKVLDDMILNVQLDSIGQIAIEVHALEPDIMKVTNDTKHFIEYKRILLELETKGFRRVSYWDNVQPTLRLKDKHETIHESAGELLLVNTKWYDPDFRKEGRSSGLNFLEEF